MPRPVRPVLVATLAAALFLGAGCTSTITGTAAPTGAAGAAPTSAAAASADPVAWTNNVCGALKSFADVSAQQPDIDPNDPAAAIKSLSSYLGTAVGGVDKALAGLKAAGPSPIAGGDEVVKKVSDLLTTFKSTFSDAKTKLDAADPNDPTSLEAAVAPLSKLADIPDPTADLKANPDLDKAAAQAPNCKALPGGGLGG